VPTTPEELFEALRERDHSGAIRGRRCNRLTKAGSTKLRLNPGTEKDPPVEDRGLAVGHHPDAASCQVSPIRSPNSSGRCPDQDVSSGIASGPCHSSVAVSTPNFYVTHMSRSAGPVRYTTPLGFSPVTSKYSLPVTDWPWGM
jgi:hypothetical protein